MDAQLMAASGPGMKLYPCPAIGGRQYLPLGYRLLRGIPIIGFRETHSDPTGALHIDERRVDCAVRGLGNTLENGPIGFRHLPSSEKLGHSDHRLPVAGEDQAARGVAVQAMG